MPFCGTDLLDVENSRNITNICDFLSYLVSLYGQKLYTDNFKLKELIEKFFSGDPKLKRVCVRVVAEDKLSENIYTYMTLPDNERKQYYDTIIKDLCEQNFFDFEFSKFITDEFIKGLLLQADSSNEKSDVDPFTLLLKKAESGDLDAIVSVADAFFYGKGVTKDSEKAFKWYMKSAQQNHVAAQNSVGVCYEEGKGVSQSYEEAFKWYKKSAEQGNKYAQNNIGIFYSKGRGTFQSNAEAFKWYMKAAEQNYVDAQYNVGICYIDGIGVAKDKEEGMKWLQKAADNGDQKAINKIKSIKSGFWNIFK